MVLQSSTSLPGGNQVDGLPPVLNSGAVGFWPALRAATFCTFGRRKLIFKIFPPNRFASKYFSRSKHHIKKVLAEA